MNELDSHNGYSVDTSPYNSTQTVSYNSSYNYNSNVQNSPLSNQPNNRYPEKNKKKIKVSFNSPAVLSFAIICFIVLIIQYIFGDTATYLAFSVYRSSLLDPMTYVRFFCHTLGHADFEHYISNMMYLLIVGPLLEEKYGSRSIVLVMVVTAAVTGLFDFVFCPNTAVLGASGIVFAFILLSSLTCVKQGEIPLTFILVAVLYLGQQVLQAALVADDISNLSHIVGGLCGSLMGYMLNKNRISAAYQQNAAGGFTYY